MKFIPHNTGIPRASISFFMDGNKICCVNGKFKNIQESPAGFGDTFDEAFEDLKKEMRKQAEKRVKYRREHPKPTFFCLIPGCDGILTLQKGTGYYRCPKCGRGFGPKIVYSTYKWSPKKYSKIS